MPEASADYLTLGDKAKARKCTVGLTVVKVGKRSELAQLIVRWLGGDKPELASEPVVAGDHNGAATRLLSRLKRKEKW